MSITAMRKIIAACAAWVGIAFAAPKIWDGTADVSWYESSAQAYNLTTAEQLAGLAKLVNDSVSDFKGKTITLGADIFLNDTTGAGAGTWANAPHRSWTPIGSKSRPFRGEFDGIAGKKNRKIYGLYFNDSTASYVGLFGCTSKVKISNLDILVGSVAAKDNVGALVGYTAKDSITITNVHSEVNMIGNNYVGGLVGYFIGSLSKSSAKSFVKGDYSYIGGVAGYAWGSIDSVYHVGGDVSGFFFVGGLAGDAHDVTSSYSEGKVNGHSYVGGLVGSGSQILKSYSKSTVKGDSICVGGLAGNASEIINSYSEGKVNGHSYVGGLVGRNGYRILKSYAVGYVKGDSNYVGGVAGYVTGKIDSVYHVGGDVRGFSYVGGLVGQTNNSVMNSYSEGNVTGTGNFVGGLIGLSYYSYSDSSNVTVMTALKSYAVGNVKGKGCVGGLVGLDSVYRKSYNTATLVKKISDSYSLGNVVGSDKYVGGVLGKFDNGSNANSKISLQILSSYHKNGYVLSDSSYVGGVVGMSNNSSIESSYHVGGDISGSGYVGGLGGYIGDVVKNSYSEGNIIGTNDYVGGLIGFGTSVDSSSHTKGDVYGRNYVGGLIGLALQSESAAKADTAYVRYSYSVGYVRGVKYVGGLIGADSLYTLYKPIARIISKSSSKGVVKGVSFVGGLIGIQAVGSDSLNKYAFNTHACSHTNGSVLADSNYVGGLIGYARDSTDSSFHSGGNVNGYGWVGGLVGYGNGVITNSYSESDVTGFENYVGGLVGNGGSISKSYAKGIVTSDSSYVGGVAGYASGLIDSVYHVDGDVIGYGYVGGVAGKVDSSIKNSYSKANVTAKDKYVGGLIGSGFSISKSYAEGTVKSDSSYVGGVAGYVSGSIDSVYHIGGNVSGHSYVGGIAGKANSSMKNSQSKANVVAKGEYVGGLVGFGSSISKSNAEGAVKSDSSYVGGIAGRTGGTVDSVYHIGGNVSGFGWVGGLVGYGASITNSFAKGIVTSDSSYVGGLAGRASDIRNSYAVAKYVKGQNSVGGLVGSAAFIEGSYFDGDSVTGVYQIGGLAGSVGGVDSSYSTAHVKGDDNVGGLIGSANGSVSNSYATGNVVGDEDHSSAGNDNLGGLVGYQYSGYVSKSMALGNVSGTTKLGGLVGRFDGTEISQSYANGNVTGSYYGDPADEVGNYYIGGLVGYAKGSLEETYTSGVVKGIEGEPVYTGCIAGYVNGSLSVRKSYYDKTKCDLEVGCCGNAASVSGTSGETTGSMKYQSTFRNWDFEDTWKILKDTYPFLQIYSNSLTNAVVTTNSLEKIKYDGEEHNPLVLSVSLFGDTLTYKNDYTVTYKDNINAGKASINICGVKPYGGCKIVEFEIAGIAVKPTIAAIENMAYTGHALTPEIKVYNGETLLAPTDYAVEYKNNVNVGTATVSVTMKGNYSGSASKSFTIEKGIPIIYQEPRATEVRPGKTLATSVLSEGFANVKGEFMWKKPTTKPISENDGYAVLFVPKDTANYKSVELSVPIRVFDIVYMTVHVGNVTLDSVVLEKNSIYTLPYIPDSVGYDFIGFYNGKKFIGNVEDSIIVNENMVIDAVYQLKNYEVTFKNGTEILQTSDFAYGSIPVYNGSIPTKSSIGECSYSFKGWYPTLTPVTKSATYTAVFDSSFAVVFKNGETELQKSYEAYGSMPIYNGSTPTKASTGRCEYTFKDWNPTLASVTKPATYTAVFDSSFIIVFKNGVTVLQSSAEAYGAKPQYIGTTPTKASAKYYYSFKGWRPSLAIVKDSATYTAVFDSTLRDYAISFKVGTTTLQKKYVNYGTKPSYTSSTPTKASSDKYTYTFKGWKPTIVSVTDSATYQAVFDSTLRKYTITFKNGSTTLQTSEIAYGSKPSYTGDTPIKASDKYTYKFKGWNPAIATVTKAATYQAVFDSTKVTGIIENRLASLDVTVRAVSRSIQISAASKNSTYTVLDMQGRVLLRGRVESSNFNIAVPRAGCYLVRVGNATRKVQVK